MFQYSVGGAVMPDTITYGQDCMWNKNRIYQTRGIVRLRRKKNLSLEIHILDKW